MKYKFIDRVAGNALAAIAVYAGVIAWIATVNQYNYFFLFKETIEILGMFLLLSIIFSYFSE